MPQNLIITFIAHDKPGVVQQLSKVVTANGGNWLESRMAHLSEMFAGVTRVSVTEDSAGTLKTALSALGSDDFQIMVHDAADSASGAGGPVITFEIVGPDHPGIVHELTRTVAKLGANVEEMETHIEDAPMGGGTLFHAETKVRLPEGLSEEEFRDALEDSAESLFVDIAISDDD